MPTPRWNDAANLASTEIREDLKTENLSFTEIAKRVGEQWQVLPVPVKASYESQAAAAKERYRTDLQEYKKTSYYREYNDYLANFKLKNNIAPHTGTVTLIIPTHLLLCNHRFLIACRRQATKVGNGDFRQQ